MLGFSITVSVGGRSEQTHSGARQPSDLDSAVRIISTHVHTNRVEQSFHGVLWTHGPAGQGDGSSAEVVAVVKERLVHPRQGHLFLGTQ